MSAFSSSAVPREKTAVETLQEIAELHRDIFHCFLEREGTVLPVKRFDSVLVDVFNRTVEFCTIHPQQAHYCEDFNDPAALRAARHPFSEDPAVVIPFFPEGTDPSLEISYKKFNMCDLSVAMLLGSLEEQIQEYFPDAVVDWLEVSIAPTRKFSRLERPVDPSEPSLHSTILVTIPDIVDSYVIDFTIEQFGYDKWILPTTEYINFRATTRWNLPDLTETLTALEPYFPADHAECRWIVQDLCTKLDWTALMGMERQERRREVITQACKVLDSDKDQVLRKYLGITPT
jgi:hypothetical protein